MSSTDYQKFHASCADVQFPPCRQSTCEHECCDAKPVEMEDDTTFEARTICSESELRAMADQWRRAMPAMEFKRYCPEGYTPQVLIAGCQTAKGCGLGDLRPLTCKMAPFEVADSTGILEVEREGCRHALEIARNPEARAVALQMLAELGFPEDTREAWNSALEDGSRIIQRETR